MESEISNPRDKYQLRTYLEGIDLNDSSLLEEKAEEIVANVRNIMFPYAEGARGKPLADYYRPAVDWIERAYKSKDFKKDFPDAVDFMIGSLEWE